MVAKKAKRGAAGEQNDDKPVLFNRIAVLRAERGLSRKDLADAVSVNYQTIGYLERGDYSPSLVLALRIARYFNLPVEMVFDTEPLRPLSEQVTSSDKRKDSR